MVDLARVSVSLHEVEVLVGEEDVILFHDSYGRLLEVTCTWVLQNHRSQEENGLPSTSFYVFYEK